MAHEIDPRQATGAFAYEFWMKAPNPIKEFHTLPVWDKLIQYDSIAVNTIVKNKTGEVSSRDLQYSDNLEEFNQQYLKYTTEVADTCQDRVLSGDRMVIGTSAIIDTDIDSADGWCTCRTFPYQSAERNR